MSLFDRIKNALTGSSTFTHAHYYSDLIDTFILSSHPEEIQFYQIKLSEYELAKPIYNLTPEQSLEMLLFCLSETGAYIQAHHQEKKKIPNISAYFVGTFSTTIKADADIRHEIELLIIEQFLHRELPFGEVEIQILLDWITYLRDGGGFVGFPSFQLVISVVEHFSQDNSLNQKVKDKLSKIESIMMSGWMDQSERKLLNRIKALINESKGLSLAEGEPWADAANNYLTSLEPALSEKWQTLLQLCFSATGSKPTNKWLKQANILITDIDTKLFYAKCLEWFLLVDKPRTIPLETLWVDTDLNFDEANLDVLKGLVWCCAIKEDANHARTLTKLALTCFKKIPGVGPRAARVGNACIAALSLMPGRTGLYQLAVLQIKLKNKSALKLINNATPSGKIQKTVPSIIKADFADDLKEIKGAVKDIKAMIPVQKQRIEQLFLKTPEWEFDTWAERYLNHPIVGFIAQKLIWVFSKNGKQTLAIFHKNQWLTETGTVVSEIDSDYTVQLWHPINSDVATIKAWRQCIINLEIVQPFKQAHREIYLLTDAEINTKTYSNRFASHIIKQHQFKALCTARDWSYTLQGGWDGDDPIATRQIEKFGIVAEFWNTVVESEMNDTGIFNYISTDQVRFYKRKTLDNITEQNIDSNAPTPLEEIPSLVLSEVFRDVDLYVGVCSVGNDPEWSDGGVDGRFHTYWHSYSFGELSATAETRKEILENLLPKLKFGTKCKIVDKFLVVEGRRRIYKIHLGSGNILMEPNNQYLCIVPDAKKSQKNTVFLPFEGDNMMSIILSKAALLTDDHKIKDRTINSQIDHH